jgi:plasmid stabilization system protein ParE
MRYRVELAETAKADIREQARWLRDRASPARADRWLAGLSEAIESLGSRPGRCPVAAESEKFPEEIRELLYGRGRHKHRIIFTIGEEAVYVVYVRHGARDELEP